MLDRRDFEFQAEALAHDAQAVGRELGRLIQRAESLATATLPDGASLEQIVEHGERARKALGRELAQAVGPSIRSLRLP